MPETFKRASIHEVAIRAYTSSPHTDFKYRAEEGDIVAVRKEGRRGIGTGEMHDFLWLRLQGLDDNVMSQLTDTQEEGDEIVAKRRYCIPFRRLKQLIPAFNDTKAKDRAIPYQYFLGVEEVFSERETVSNLDMSTSSHSAGVGWIRLPLMNDAIVVNPPASPNVQVSVPSGWSWSFPWLVRNRMNRDEAKADMGTWKAMAEWMRAETRSMVQQGPLIQVFNPEGKLTNTTISYTVTTTKRGSGDFMAKYPALDVEGLVFDKQTMRYL